MSAWPHDLIAVESARSVVFAFDAIPHRVMPLGFLPRRDVWAWRGDRGVRIMADQARDLVAEAEALGEALAACGLAAHGEDDHE